MLSVAGVVVGSTELALTLPEGQRRGGAAKASLSTYTELAPHEAEAILLPPVPSQPTQVTTAPPAAGWTGRWNAPVYDLEDFLKRAPGVHLPPQSIMLTVDDGPHPEWTPKYLRLFEQYDVKATFSVIGTQIDANQNIVRAIASEGHTLANHTWSHDLALHLRPQARIQGEIARTNDAINRVTGVHPTIFRAPGGNWGPAIFDELARENLLPLAWDIDPRDWALPGVQAIQANMMQARPGDILLCHDGGGDRSQTFEALKTVIPALKSRGLNFVQIG